MAASKKLKQTIEVFDPIPKRSVQVKAVKHLPMKRFFNPTIFLVLLLVTSIGVAGYFYVQADKLKKNPQQVAQEEVQSLVARVSKLIVLPEKELPTLATVSDPERLKEQPFFAKAKKGDKVLIYTNAKKAILYDPVQNKIVEVAPINIGENTQQVNPTPSSSPTPAPTP